MTGGSTEMDTAKLPDEATLLDETEAGDMTDEGAAVADMRHLEALPADTGGMPERTTADSLIETELFQVRAGIFSAHVEGLARALKQDGDLQPLLVLRRGGKLFLIDGRHRKRAYEQSGRRADIPVVEFRGTPKEALLEGQRVNKMHTLAMTKDERMNGAWKLVRLDAARVSRFTLPQIMAAGAGRGQVTFMRKVLRELQESGQDCLGFATWKEALKAHSKQPGREYTDEEIEDMNNTEGEEAANRMLRVFGTRLADRPEVLAIALEHYTGRRLPELMGALAERNGQRWGEDEGDEFPDF